MNDFVESGRRQVDVSGNGIHGQAHLLDLFEQQGTGMRSDSVLWHASHGFLHFLFFRHSCESRNLGDSALALTNIGPEKAFYLPPLPLGERG